MILPSQGFVARKKVVLSRMPPYTSIGCPLRYHACVDSTEEKPFAIPSELSADGFHFGVEIDSFMAHLPTPS